MMFSLLDMLFLILTMLNLITLNIQGINDPTKRKFAFDFLLKRKIDIIALQEVHSTLPSSQEWSKEWPGLSYWNSFTCFSAGVAILFNPNLDVSVMDIDKDNQGRRLALTVDIDTKKFRIMNIYAPNPKIREKTEEFYEELFDFSDVTIPNILVGDFNMVESVDLDRLGGTPKAKHAWGLSSLNDLKDKLHLKDFWRVTNPNLRAYTWNSFHDNISSRLDRIYMPKELFSLTSRCAIQPFSWSDHDYVRITFELPDTAPRGPGYWKLNTSLLEDEGYRKVITDFWQEWNDTL